MNIVKTAVCVLIGGMTLSACTLTQSPNSMAKTQANIQQQSAQLPKISVQLWSVKNDVKNDFEGTLRKIANMGFKGVEFAGEYGPYQNNPLGLKKFLTSLGLEASGAHVQMKLLRGEKLAQTIDFLTKLETKLVIIPIDVRAWQPEGIQSLADELTELTPKLAQHGLTLGYHNHAKEFNDFQQQTFWDYLAQHTPQAMFLQMDVGWVNFAGKDPIEYVKRYPNRTLATHIKIRTQGSTGINTIIGQDNFDWAELVKTDIKYGATRWLVIEQEEYPQGYTPMMSIEASKKGLESFLKQLDI